MRRGAHHQTVTITFFGEFLVLECGVELRRGLTTELNVADYRKRSTFRHTSRFDREKG